MLSAADQANQRLVDRLIAEGALRSASLIAAFRATPRHRFLDRVFQYQSKRNCWREVITRDPGTEELEIIYSDRALITHLSSTRAGQAGSPISSSSQPSLMAQMLEDLRLDPGLCTLEVGAGTGYNAALLAHVVGPERVTSVEVDRNVLSEAWDHLRAFPERRIDLQYADGRLGHPAKAPFDRLIVTAATPELEPAWLQQLAEQGRLLAPLALAPGLGYVVCGTMSDGIFQGRLTRTAYFMGLREEGTAGPPSTKCRVASAGLRTLPAPWAGWFDRKRPRSSWLGFIQALAFYGFLRGLEVHHQILPSGESQFGLTEGSAICWLGADHWQVNGDSGHDLGAALWRAFLDAGGPRPTEFWLRTSLHHEIRPTGREAYVHSGARLRLCWERREEKDEG